MSGRVPTARLLQAYRAGILTALILLVHQQDVWLEAQQAPSISLRQAGRFFPEARRMSMPDPDQGLHVVTDPLGRTVGGLMITAPWTDHIIGYSGPNNLLLVLEPNGTLQRVELISSEDTREHVDMVRNAAEFLPALSGWRPGREPLPEVQAVSGATLTSFAMLESLQARLVGAAPSLRFPEPVTLDEVRALFPKAEQVEAKDHGLRVLDGSGRLLGHVLRTSPQSDNVSGYQGPSESLLALDPEGRTVIGFVLRRSYDTTSYVDKVREASGMPELFLGKDVDDLASLSFPRRQPEGVSGATRTAEAVVEGVQRRMAKLVEADHPERGWRPRGRDLALAGVVAMGVVMAWSPWRGRPWVRVVWCLFLVGYVGMVHHDMLSLSLLSGWSAHGVAWRAAPGLVLLAAAAVMLPLMTRRQVYCHQLCPHGAAQQLLGRVLRRRWTLPGRLSDRLEVLPVILLGAALASLVAGWGLNLASLEAFDAWNWRSAGWATLSIATVGLVVSLFVPMAYCRYGCPTGAIFSFVRSSGRADRWGRRDAVALALLLSAASLVAGVRLWPRAEAATEPVLVTGHAMGTTWSVKLRDEVASPPALEETIGKEFEWAEALTSNWRTNTQLSIFNRALGTNAQRVPWPVMTLVKWSAEISRESGGAFDITVGPLVRAWGFGPGATRGHMPDDRELDTLQDRVGWEKLELLDGGLRKKHPALEVDLSGIAKGWAINKVVDELVFQGYTNILVEAGGELRAVGTWKIAIEHPTRTAVLRDESIASSGTYRQRFEEGNRRSNHLIDPRTGRPVQHRTVSVSVRHPDCAQADGWATAFNVLGLTEGMPIATRLELAVQFVQEESNGALKVVSSPAWQQREYEVERSK